MTEPECSKCGRTKGESLLLFANWYEVHDTKANTVEGICALCVPNLQPSDDREALNERVSRARAREMFIQAFSNIPGFRMINENEWVIDRQKRARDIRKRTAVHISLQEKRRDARFEREHKQLMRKHHPSYGV